MALPCRIQLIGRFSEIFNDGGSVIGFPAAPQQIDRMASL
jgi:hypothetical protein